MLSPWPTDQDLTIRKLEERIRGLESALEERDAEMVGARERAVADADAARLAVMAEREVGALQKSVS